jgi:hypothetical protein
MLYVETSLIVVALSNEILMVRARARGWLAEQDLAQLLISGWTVTEMSSAIPQRTRPAAEMIEAQAGVPDLARGSVSTE